MKAFIRVTSTSIALITAAWAEEAPASVAIQPQSWSLVYLPDLDWTEGEAKQTLALLHQLKPGLVVSMSPCPFAEKIRNLECKPTVLDQTQRSRLGVACGLPANPLNPCEDTSTLHSIGHAEGGSSALVWLSSAAAKNKFNGPDADLEELKSFSRMQVRKQLGERRGDVVFLVDASVPTPPEKTWRLPLEGVSYEQAPSRVTGFACIRPDSLQTSVRTIDGIAPRVPVLHWIHSGTKGMEWEVLPTDGGPAIQHSVLTHLEDSLSHFKCTIGRVKAPPAPPDVPLWMDDYINNNPALDCGENIQQGAMRRRFGWTNYGVTRDPFQLLLPGETPPSKGKTVSAELPHGAVRSPDNLFSITVGQLGEKGWYPEDADDGVNVYLKDLRTGKNCLLYFACLSCAWPSTATWFTDRYVITSGTANHSLDEIDETHLWPRFDEQTLHLFDLQTGRSFVTASTSRAADQSRPNSPTERIYFPHGLSSVSEQLSYDSELRWRSLWKAIEDGYHAKPEQAPFTMEQVADLTKLPKDTGMQWQDLGIWPPPETWRLASGKKDENMDCMAPKPVAGGDPFLTYTETSDGQRRYTVAIAGYFDQEQFVEQDTITQIVAHADLFTTGAGSLPQIETIRRMGESKQYLVFAGTYQKPGMTDSSKVRWMLLIDLLHHHSWSAHG